MYVAAYHFETNTVQIVNKHPTKPCKCYRHEVPVTCHPITIVHMDEDIVVVNKPASIPVSGAETAINFFFFSLFDYSYSFVEKRFRTATPTLSLHLILRSVTF